MRRPRRCISLSTTATLTPTRGGGTDADGAGGGEAAPLPPAKRPRLAIGDDDDAFDRLPDDVVLTVLARVAAAAASPADVAAAALTCRRFRELTAHPAVLSRTSAAAVAVRAGGWSEAAHRFLLRCAAAGSLHACYFLGMVRFYCLGSRATGAALLARAAAGGHAPALYALAVVQFNGSGGGKADKDPRAGVALCARAAWLGHAPHFASSATASRTATAHAATPSPDAASSSTPPRELHWWHCRCRCGGDGGGAEEDAASQFMVEWWETHTSKRAAKLEAGGGDDDGGADLRLCSQERCGRQETRRHEFRRCSVCGSAIYCSRACQALHWKRAHRAQCAARWLAAGDAH